MRAFSGVTIGIIGGLIGIHWSLAFSALSLLRDPHDPARPDTRPRRGTP